MDWEQRILTVDEVASIVRLRARTVRELLKKGELPGRKIGRVWRIPGSALKEFLGGHNVSAVRELEDDD